MLPAHFRKLSITRRREIIRQLVGRGVPDGIPESSGLLELAGILVEYAVGYLPVPLGIVSDLSVNNRSYLVPLATEEPSVIAAANYAAGIISRQGGLTAASCEPVMRAHVYLQNPRRGLQEELAKQQPEISALLRTQLKSMEQRGGGLRGMDTLLLPELDLLRVEIRVDVRDAFGANVLNSAAEFLQHHLEKISCCRALMSILSNAIPERLSTASFRLPVEVLKGGRYTSAETAARIELASRLAETDPDRAVTHNKGIMNGLTALALATGNDTRATEAAIHAYAGASGKYRSLSSFLVRAGFLEGRIALPLALATWGVP